MLVFCTTPYAYFADALAALLAQQTGSGEVTRGGVARNDFPDGEHYHRLLHNPADRRVLLVGGTTTDADTLELFDLGTALVQNGAESLQVVIPYFGYATMERAVLPGEVVKARTRALLLSAIPPAARGTRVWLLDLHSEGIPHYFAPTVNAHHLYAKQVVMQMARAAAGGTDFVLAATDSGRAKWVESLATDMQQLGWHVDAAFVYKRRTSGTATHITGVNADVNGRAVVIYDDMVRTGGSLLSAAQVYKNAGAKSIDAVATHLLLPGGALQRIESSGLLRSLHGTDSHLHALQQANGFLKVQSVAGVFAQALQRHGQW
jgi:ribose-phosphate pyrophosphokinase